MLRLRGIRAHRFSPDPLALVACASACAIDELGSDDELGNPPDDADTFDPDVGDDGGSSTGSSDDGEADTDDTGPVECDDANKRCPYQFTLADMGYQTATLVGNFAPSGWDVGVPMELSDGTWRVTIDVPWATEVIYKFKLDGGAQWIPDPNNPNQIADGFGGYNSVLEGQTCAEYTCAPDLIGTFDWRDSILYFVFVDRFNDGNPNNNGPIGVEELADWQGGDWAGVMAKIDEGYFTELGVNTLWLSVPANNTNESGLGLDGHDYSAYHGYWPQHLDQTEEHFGTLEELQALVELAHANDIKVIVDYAMNHVHSSSPVYQQNPGWFWPNDNGQGAIACAGRAARGAAIRAGAAGSPGTCRTSTSPTPTRGGFRSTTRYSGSPTPGSTGSASTRSSTSRISG
ncbi:MAG: hypothetical protein HC927_07770 [Deltaproteobacteria bacterium]|nr:hypothetical protein [Deltaproteobacteria bacterium]